MLLHNNGHIHIFQNPTIDRAPIPSTFFQYRAGEKGKVFGLIFIVTKTHSILKSITKLCLLNRLDFFGKILHLTSYYNSFVIPELL